MDGQMETKLIYCAFLSAMVGYNNHYFDNMFMQNFARSVVSKCFNISFYNKQLSNVPTLGHLFLIKCPHPGAPVSCQMSPPWGTYFMSNVPTLGHQCHVKCQYLGGKINIIVYIDNS
jgi:hypothetical protein